MAYQLSAKNFENPVKSTKSYYKEITAKTFKAIYSRFGSGVPSWGSVVNNACYLYEHKTHSRVKVEEVSYNNTGFNARFYLVIK